MSWRDPWSSRADAREAFPTLIYSTSPMGTPETTIRLRLRPHREYAVANPEDPLRFYYWPILGPLYRRRVELCLGECTGGGRVLEVGFGAGITFPVLAQLYEEIHGLELEARFKAVRDGLGGLRDRICLFKASLLSMPYRSVTFDTVLLISVLEHLRTDELQQAFSEIHRVLRPGGQVVYGLPVERPLMVAAFAFLGYDIRKHHFSAPAAVAEVAGRGLRRVHLRQMSGTPRLLGPVYEVGHFVRD